MIVSDHGMATVAPGHAIAIEDMVSREAATVVSIGQSVGITPNPGFEAAVESTLLGAHEHYDCWRKGELPARWHYGTHPRIPPIVRSEEHTSELQSLMRISYAVFCLKNKKTQHQITHIHLS